MIARLTLVGLGLGALASCSKAPQCVDNGQCGDMQACIEEECVQVECLASAQCGLEQFCDVQRDYTCKSGCEHNTDCQAGFDCNPDSHQCEAYGCRSTDLDCGYGEVCDESSGECKRAQGDHCKTCSDPYFGSGCNKGTCYLFDEESFASYCVVDCNPSQEDACPRGYECVDVLGDGASYGCFAWCPSL